MRHLPGELFTESLKLIAGNLLERPLERYRGISRTQPKIERSLRIGRHRGVPTAPKADVIAIANLTDFVHIDTTVDRGLAAALSINSVAARLHRWGRFWSGIIPLTKTAVVSRSIASSTVVWATKIRPVLRKNGRTSWSSPA